MSGVGALAHGMRVRAVGTSGFLGDHVFRIERVLGRFDVFPKTAVVPDWLRHMELPRRHLWRLVDGASLSPGTPWLRGTWTLRFQPSRDAVWQMYGNKAFPFPILRTTRAGSRFIGRWTIGWPMSG